MDIFLLESSVIKVPRCDLFFSHFKGKRYSPRIMEKSIEGLRIKLCATESQSEELQEQLRKAAESKDMYVFILQNISLFNISTNTISIPIIKRSDCKHY